MAITKDEVVEYLKGITLLEASELVKELEEVFGVSAAAAAAPMMMAAPAGGAGAGIQGFQGAAVVGAGLYIWCASCILDTTGSVLAWAGATFFAKHLSPLPRWKWPGPCGASV